MPQKVTGKRKATGEPKRSGGSSEDAAEPELLGKESEAESNNKSSKRQKSRFCTTVVGSVVRNS